MDVSDLSGLGECVQVEFSHHSVWETWQLRDQRYMYALESVYNIVMKTAFSCIKIIIPTTVLPNYKFTVDAIIFRLARADS